MLIKILLLSVLAYFVFRAAGNLIAAIRQDGLPDARERVRQPPGDRKRESQRPATVRDDSEDIEDARFEDL